MVSATVASLMYYNKRFVFPLQFCAGIVGNALNLVVLNSAQMRTKTNLFLSALAIADLCFFVVALPLNLVIYGSPPVNETTDESLPPAQVWFNSFISHVHVPSMMLVNWFSASSIWYIHKVYSIGRVNSILFRLSVGVTIERALVVTFPIIAKTTFTKRRIMLGICLIFLFSFILSGYHFFGVEVEECPSCYMQHKFVPVELKTDPHRYRYWHISHILFAFFVVAIPLVALVVLNGLLIHQLNLNRLAMRRFQQASHLRNNERKATIMVIVIIVAFVVTNVPSGFYIAIQVIYTLGQGTKAPDWLHPFGELSNSLVCTGKALNFVLYCSASSSFRKKLVELIRRRASRGSVLEDVVRKTTDISLASPMNGNSLQETTFVPLRRSSQPSSSVRSICRYRSRTATTDTTDSTDAAHLVTPLLNSQPTDDAGCIRLTEFAINHDSSPVTPPNSITEHLIR